VATNSQCHLRPPPSGDYNGNGIVDAADYVVWRKTLDLTADPEGSGADGNESGSIDDGDYAYWKTRFGASAIGNGGLHAVPEPATALMLLVATPLALFRIPRYDNETGD